MEAQACASPRVRVAAVILIDGKVILVRQSRGAAPYFLLPGGGVDYRETLEQALIREVHEETGLIVALGEPMFISDTIDPNGSRHVVNITFGATRIGGSLHPTSPDSAIEGIELVAPEKLCEIDLRPPIAEQLACVLLGGESRLGYLGSLFTPESNMRGV
ncbi:MAG: NUDIX hydrolase [Coriobacteriia bacterium]|nr:NUDIX hydrolase [Coriobacteriia bacterium]